jgi:hypothetical protein
MVWTEHAAQTWAISISIWRKQLVANNTIVQLRPIAEHLQKVKFKAAQGQFRSWTTIKGLERFDQQPKERWILFSLSRQTVVQFGNIKATTETGQITSQHGKGTHNLALGHNIKMTPDS